MIRQASRKWVTCPMNRFGLTILEVLISIGVVIIGLVGVAALVPIAARDAGRALQMDTANRIAEGAMAELKARNAAGQLAEDLFYEDIDPGDDDGLGPAEGWRRLSDVLGTPFVLDSPGFLRSLSAPMASFCIDPDFFSKNPNVALTGSAYHSARFPYYHEEFVGSSDPTTFTASGGPPVFPRMYRVGFGQLISVSPTVAEWIPEAIADRMTRSDGKMSMHQPRDSTMEPSQVIQNLDAPGSGPPLQPGARLGVGRYTWFATLVPQAEGGNPYTLSVVVVDLREANAGLASPGGDPRSNPKSERLVWLTNPVPLGSTTQVTMVGSNAISDDLVAGQWVMLSRQAYAGGSPDGAATHRWFRVVHVGQRQEGPITAAPYSTSSPLSGVWYRQVVLEGANWTFGNANNGSGMTALVDDTFATIVDGAVIAKQSFINL